MTYCAAFITDNSIILTSDTIETYDNTCDTKNDTFFSESTKFNGYEVSDTALKLFKLNENRILCASGKKDSIIAAVSFLKEHTNSYPFMASLFQSLESSLSLEVDSVQIFCAENYNGTLFLGAWSSGRGLSFPANQTKKANALLMGTAMIDFKFITENVSNMISNYSHETLPHQLALINSYHQLVGVHTDTTKSKFGGAYTSAAMTKEGVVWQPDVTYFLYSPSELNPITNKKLEAFEAINVMMRDGLLFLERRTPIHRNILLTALHEYEEIELAVKKHGASLYDKALSMSTDYKVFLSREKPYVVFLHHIDPEYCVKIEVSDKIAHNTYSEDFYALLKAQPEVPFMQGAAKIEIVPRGLLSEGYEEPKFSSTKKD